MRPYIGSANFSVLQLSGCREARLLFSMMCLDGSLLVASKYTVANPNGGGLFERL